MDVIRCDANKQTDTTLPVSPSSKSQAHQSFEALTDIGYSPTVVVFNGLGTWKGTMDQDGSRLKEVKVSIGFPVSKQKGCEARWTCLIFSETKRYEACRHYEIA